MDEILSKIFAILTRLEGRQYEGVSGQTAIADLQLDSMNVAHLLVELEVQFDIALADDELDRVATLSDLARCIQRQRELTP